MKNLPKNLKKFLWKYGFKPYRMVVSLWVVISIIYGFFNGVLTPLLNKWFVALFEKSLPAGTDFVSFAIPTIITITAILITQTILGTLRNVTFAHWTPKVRNNMSQAMTDYVNGQSMRFYIKRMPGKINSQINYVVNSFNVVDDMIKIFVIVLVVLFNIGMILNIDKWVAILLGVAFLLRFMYGVSRIRPMNVASKVASESSSVLSGKIVDSISNFSIVKLFSGSKIEKSYMEPVRTKVIRDSIHSSFMQRLFWVPQVFLWDIMFGITMFLCAKLYMSGHIKVSEIVFTVSIYTTVMEYIDGMVEQIPNLVDVKASAQQAYEELIEPIEIRDSHNATDLHIKKGVIEIRNVSFSYGKRKVLDDLSLIIKPGEKVGIVGSSGAGKTTIVNLLMRFYDPSRGAIFIDGQNIKKVKQDSLRNNITFIPQEPSLFNRTLFENIAYGKHNATLKEVRCAAKQAIADDFIMKTSKKYESMVGDRGTRLSGGQRQRVVIARAFLKNAPILMLDEATSALDSETEAVIQKSFEELSKGRTTIAIAHRLSTLRNMDRIIVLDKGKIAESGKHSSLIKKRKGIYAKLWKMQSGGFIKEKQ
ncbi:MAG TPA: ABC transporter ATP-binding protein [Alphaproteobacteria bacterium]|nr:ABC transporter ATP-binding protein [Alphaproteobacteria bacterium]